MNAGKLGLHGVRHVVVTSISSFDAASEIRQPAAGATRHLQVTSPVLPGAWSEQPRDPLPPGTLALRRTVRPGRPPAVAGAVAFGTVALLTAILLGWLALRDDPLFPEVMGGPVQPQSFGYRESAIHPPRVADARVAVPGRAPTDAGYGLKPVPIEGRTAGPIDQTTAFVYALGSPRSQMPIATDGPLPTAGEMRSAVAAASSEPSKAGASGAAHALPAAGLVAERQEAPKLDPSALMARGDEFLRQSDVTSARLFYRLAAVNGSAAGAMAMGSTYDPVFLEHNAVRGIKPDAGKALEWYRKAVELGDPGGKTRSAELLEILRVDAARGDPQARAVLEKATK